MKKTIITIMATVCVMSILFGGIIYGISENYKTELADIEKEYINREGYFLDGYEELMENYSNLKADMINLESEVYKMMNGDDYNITVQHNDRTHNWTKVKENWLFSEKSYTIY